MAIELIGLKTPENSIKIIRNPSPEMLQERQVFTWHTWSKEPSDFYWKFTERESAYILDGEVYLTPDGSDQTVLLKKGDFVVFEPGLRCHWRVTKAIHKRVTLERNFFVRTFWRATFVLKAIPRFFSPQPAPAAPATAHLTKA